MNLNVNLQDPIRNYAYEQILPRLYSPIGARKLLDIGCRDSGFPAYLDSLGYETLAIDRDDFSLPQETWAKRFNSKHTFLRADLLDLKEPTDIITAVYALQHNVEKDIECYRKCAELATQQIFIVNEFNYSEPKLHLGRDDGDMRIYSHRDLEERIISPITELKKGKVKNISSIFSRFEFEKQSVHTSDIKEANTVTIIMEFQ